MRTGEYRFLTIWRIEAPLEAVWRAVHDAGDWPRWWRNVEAVSEIEPGDAQGVGALHRYTWKGVLPYRLTFDVRVTRIEPQALLEGSVTGALAGTGRWRFSRENGVTVVRYEWRVETQQRWMNLLAPLARPLFRWNHDAVMREGGIALAGLLGARVAGIEQRMLTD